MQIYKHYTPPDQGKKKVLLCIVVEDEPLAQQVLENYIHRIGELKLIAKCESVEEAYDVISSNEVDVVFLDLQLKTAAGVELFQKLKCSDTNRYYIVITSAIPPQQLKINNVSPSDCICLVDHLTKPFSFDRFLDAVYKILDKKDKD